YGSRIALAALTCPGRRKRQGKNLRLEKTVGRILGRALLGDGLLQPLDLRSHQRDTLRQLLDRQQRQVLADLVADFLPRLVVIFDRHAFLLTLRGSRSGCQPEPGWLIRGRRSILPRFARTNHGKAARANDRRRYQQARRPRSIGTGNSPCTEARPGRNPGQSDG